MRLKNAVTGTEATQTHLSPCMRKALEYVDSLPDGEYVTLVQIADKLGASPDSIKNGITRTPLAQQRIRHSTSRAYWYVNKKTYEELVKDGELG